MYSERLEVRAAVYAGELIQQGAIGTRDADRNLAPHRVNARAAPHGSSTRPATAASSPTSARTRPTSSSTTPNSTKAHSSLRRPVTSPSRASRSSKTSATWCAGNGGTGYVRVDWFTPDGLGTWGDGRLFILGTEGYIELRKYVNVAGGPGGNHLFIVDKKQARYIDCKDVPLPFGPQFVRDIVERTDVAQNQEQALLAAELVLEAQKIATKPIST